MKEFKKSRTDSKMPSPNSLKRRSLYQATNNKVQKRQARMNGSNNRNNKIRNNRRQ
jgi:hypothetical protein